jgi:hypothetical protein
VFSAPPVAADALVLAGFDVVSNANNHAWDAGLVGVFETVRQLDRVGLPHAGTGRTLADAHRPAIVQRKGWRVAFLAVTRAYNPAPGRFYTHVGSRYIAYADSAWLYPAIRRIKESGAADLVVVSMHAGVELAVRPDDRMRLFFQGAIAAGADICLGPPARAAVGGVVPRPTDHLFDGQLHLPAALAMDRPHRRVPVHDRARRCHRPRPAARPLRLPGKAGDGRGGGQHPPPRRSPRARHALDLERSMTASPSDFLKRLLDSPGPSGFEATRAGVARGADVRE